MFSTEYRKLLVVLACIGISTACSNAPDPSAAAAEEEVKFQPDAICPSAACSASTDGSQLLRAGAANVDVLTLARVMRPDEF